MTLGQYSARVLVFLVLAGLVYLVWSIRELALLVFGGVLTAVIFSLIAEPFQRWLHVPRWSALLLAVASVFALFGAVAWLFGGEIANQTAIIRTELPQAIEDLRARLAPLGLEAALTDFGQGIVARIGPAALSIGFGLADVVLVLVAGVYIAAQPDLYRRGLLSLVPKSSRGKVSEALDDSGIALRRWIVGQLIAMTVVGLLTGAGLWMLGVPAAFALGLLAALLDFVPTFGPIVAAVPGILIAFMVSPELALWSAGLYLLIQQLEGNVITPLVQQKAIDLPPALLLFSLVAGGLIFGLAGVLLAAPLTVVLMMIVKRLYVREGLHTETHLPSDPMEEP
jgi:predicted PurR-regulated permease PerM